ncbi:3-phosphoserine/phosphohydroxythreonine transaminase [Myroides injenensis]|uniref:3-phosphoserine/phosphohydroxythreonine transaminase n=1 Tax=Myroides injenensis TaxID=1183151 RepID=UPI0002894034|nr:3-phosphoserine/phosphohydroxythreonine transaminase [Myroides injenensis]
MQTIHNFCAGPCLLPSEVYQEAAKAVLNFDNSGLSILSISHRSKEFLSVLEQAKQLALELLNLEGKGYTVLFLQGGASMEFLRIPYNLLDKRAGYINTGTWSSKAIEQAKLFGEVKLVASSEDKRFTYIPKDIIVDEELDYLHFTSNNTIYGTQFRSVPRADCPIVCDMSSDIYSRTFDYDKIDLIYAGAQKNIGPAGLSVIIVKDEILGKVKRSIPNMLNYQEHIDKESLYHTANVFGIYTCLLNFKWLKNLGGVSEIEKLNNEKAATLYNAIDNLEYVKGFANLDSRSKMNVTFSFENDKIASIFDELCREENIVNIKGHRSVGGYRASLYNALSLESVQVLVSVMEALKSKV